MDKTISVGILGLGIGMPEKVLTNQDLEKIVDTSDEWITKRTGISERRILDKDAPAFKLGLEAAKNALNDANMAAEELDLIIVATITPDYLSPAMACMIQDGLKAYKAAAFDLNAACSGFVYSLTVAEQFIKTGYYKKILIIGCEGLSKIVDWQDRNTCVLFGDGSGAAILGEVEDGYGILSTKIGAEGDLGHNLTIPCCYINEKDLEKRLNENKKVMWMDGSEVFKFAVKVMQQAAVNVADMAGIKMDEVSYIVPHQANTRIIDKAAKRLKIETDKIVKNVDKYGNTSAASIPIALYEAVNDGRIKKGDNIILVGFGGGLTWAASMIKWNK